MKDGSSPLTEKTQISAVAVPLAGRNMARGFRPGPQTRTHDDVATVYAPIAAIFRLTFPAAPEPPLVLNSTTTMSLPVATGAPGVSGIVEVPDIGFGTTKICVFESVPSGFCSRTERFPATDRSAA